MDLYVTINQDLKVLKIALIYFHSFDNITFRNDEKH